MKNTIAVLLALGVISSLAEAGQNNQNGQRLGKLDCQADGSIAKYNAAIQEWVCAVDETGQGNSSNGSALFELVDESGVIGDIISFTVNAPMVDYPYVNSVGETVHLRLQFLKQSAPFGYSQLPYFTDDNCLSSPHFSPFEFDGYFSSYWLNTSDSDTSVSELYLPIGEPGAVFAESRFTLIYDDVQNAEVLACEDIQPFEMTLVPATLAEADFQSLFSKPFSIEKK